MANALSPKTPPKPTRPRQRRAFGRSLSDIKDLTAAEQRLVACCAQGEVWMPEGWDGERPDNATPANRIRGELIRFLTLGGDDAHPVHEQGVVVGGGWISGRLNLHQCRAAVRLDLQYCHFAEEPVFMVAHLPELVLTGSQIPGMNAQRCRVAGDVFLRDVFLRDGFAATGEVRLLGAEIGGDLDCSGGSFANEGGNAISADGIKVTGGVFLDEGFAATGQVRLLGAEIGGNLDCTGGSFANEGGNAISADRIKVTGSLFLRDGFKSNGEVRLPGSEIGGNLDCAGGSFANEGGNAISADGIKVTGNVFLRDGFKSNGEVRLPGSEIGGQLSCRGGSFANADGDAISADEIKVTGGVFLREATIEGAILLNTARVGTLIDDGACWPSGENELAGFHYDRIAGPTDAASRIAWLKKQRPEFLGASHWRPQPWEQVIKVLRDMGHGHEAAEVAIAKQDHMRQSGIIKGPVRRGLHWLYGKLAGYGHRPLRTLAVMILAWLACSLAFYAGRADGYFGPSNPLIHANPAFAACGAPGDMDAQGKAKPFWPSEQCPMPPEYSTMQPALYSLDLILPLVDLQQETDWAPIVVNSEGRQLKWGHALRWLMWFEILFGWVMSLMLVAVLGRLVDKD